MAEKHIVLLLDGTWNDADSGRRDTNIVRLRRIIAKSLDREPAPDPTAKPVAELSKQEMVASRTYAGNSHIVFYERGVGTGLSDWLRGGAFGKGLDDNIRRAYKFLSHHYERGDKIFIFGFSRGAYTARSLVGFIAAAGLLRREHCTADIESTAWNYYRTSPNDRLPGVWAELEPLVHNRDTFAIDCVGVFDTVGALGVPLKSFWKLNRQRYEFHDVELSSITKVNLHAIAVDEHRYPFQAAVWRKPKFKRFLTITEQVWFPGAHADIGGSYIDETQRDANHREALDDIPLDWMLKRVKDIYPNFPFDPAKAWKRVDADWTEADAHEARKNIYRLWRFAHRMPANSPGRARRWLYETGVCHDRHSDPFEEKVHISVLSRLGKKVRVDWRGKRYRPWNIIWVLEDIEKTYNAPGSDRVGPDIQIVDWSGRALNPKSPRDSAAALQLIGEARQRLGLPQTQTAPRPVRSAHQDGPSWFRGAALRLASPRRRAAAP